MPDEPETQSSPRNTVLWGWEDRPDPEGKYKLHPAALRPPPYPPWKFETLKSGFRALGQRHAIQVMPGTAYVVKGWHTLLALRDLRVPEGEWKIRAPDSELLTDKDVEED